MPLLEIIMIAIGLAMDAFAVSLAAAASGQSKGKRAAFRLSFHFGFFQFAMPVIGWYAGSTVAHLIVAIDHWVAFGLLAFIGLKMVKSGLSKEFDYYSRDPSRGLTLVALSIATSIDALAVGLSLAMININIWYPCIIIGVVTAGLSIIGIKLGSWMSVGFGKKMEIVGGIILILIGLKILVTHLF